jgi:hypothetical protein
MISMDNLGERRNPALHATWRLHCECARLRFPGHRRAHVRAKALIPLPHPSESEPRKSDSPGEEITCENAEICR